MPLEIKELHIKATIADQQQTSDSSGQDSGSSAPLDTTALIDACVEKVLEILKDKQER